MKKPNSQNAIILNELKRGAHITPMDALRLCGCFRLSARIKDLRDAGNRIMRKIVDCNGKRFAEYYLLRNKKKKAKV